MGICVGLLLGFVQERQLEAPPGAVDAQIAVTSAQGTVEAFGEWSRHHDATMLLQWFAIPSETLPLIGNVLASPRVLNVAARALGKNPLVLEGSIETKLSDTTETGLTYVRAPTTHQTLRVIQVLTEAANGELQAQGIAAELRPLNPPVLLNEAAKYVGQVERQEFMTSLVKQWARDARASMLEAPTNVIDKLKIVARDEVRGEGTDEVPAGRISTEQLSFRVDEPWVTTQGRAETVAQAEMLINETVRLLSIEMGQEHLVFVVGISESRMDLSSRLWPAPNVLWSHGSVGLLAGLTLGVIVLWLKVKFGVTTSDPSDPSSYA